MTGSTSQMDYDAGSSSSHQEVDQHNSVQLERCGSGDISNVSSSPKVPIKIKLLRAIVSGDIRAIKSILTLQELDINVRYTRDELSPYKASGLLWGPGGQTPLHIAAQTCRVEVVQLLLESGANKYAQNDNDWDVLMMAQLAQGKSNSGDVVIAIPTISQSQCSTSTSTELGTGVCGRRVPLQIQVAAGEAHA